MKELIKIVSQAVPIEIAHINTDLIIPAKHLTSTEKSGYGPYLFQQLREESKNFPLNLEQFQGRRILIALENFGCGSSREHAVWALVQYGFAAIIAPSYSDIFFNNSIKNRLPVISLNAEAVQELIQEAKSNEEFEINLQDKTVRTSSGVEMKFEMDSYTQYRLIYGVNDIDYLLKHLDEIKSHFSGGKANE